MKTYEPCAECGENYGTLRISVTTQEGELLDYTDICPACAKKPLDVLGFSIGSWAEKGLKKNKIFGDNGKYHKASGAHPCICPGCTSDESKWGNPVKTGAK